MQRGGRRRWGGRVRGSAALVALVALMLVGCAPAPGASPPEADAAPAVEPLPVVIVPGWEVFCVTRRTDWDAWTEAFVQRGLAEDHVRVAFYDTCQSNLETAAMIGRTVDAVLEETGAERVNLIAHSMGAIPTRWCVRFGSCAGRVDQVVTLAGANHGTVWAAACALQFWATSCADMQPESAMLAQLNTDESPDDVGWETWTSPCELVILPRESAFLEGAVNHDLVDDCVDHSGWKRHEPTIRSVIERLVPAGRVGGTRPH